MAIEVKVPVLPESVSDATIASWNKKAGDAVARDENLVDLETDKVVLEVPSPVDGVLKEIRFEAGATVTSQQVLAIIEEGAAPAAKAEATKPAPGKTEGTAAMAAAPAKPEAAAPAKSEAPRSAAANEQLPPGARFSAEKAGVDAAQVEGTGR
jgi:2-oxoglutarate dehydrogenase E2 component (dihydrolipoamide succinyltransferase)